METVDSTTRNDNPKPTTGYAGSPRVEALRDQLVDQVNAEARAYVERCLENDLIDEDNLDLVDAAGKLTTLERLIEEARHQRVAES